MTVTERRFFTIADIAALLRVEEGIVQQLVESGEIVGLHIGDSWRIPEGSVESYVEAGLKQQMDRPRPAQPNVSSVASATVPGTAKPRRTQDVEFTLLGKRYRARNSITVLATVLVALAERDSSFLERFSKEGGRTRRYVSRDRQSLYSDRPDLSEQFSKPLRDGWWVGTNYSRKEIDGIIQRACEVAGLRVGIDLRLGQEPMKLDVEKAMRFVGIASDPDPLASIHHADLLAESIARDSR